MATDGTCTAIYVHFPYCVRKCSYCDFSSRPVRRDQVPHDAYATAVLREWSLRSLLMKQPIRSISLYFGGGTPSLWSAASIGRVIEEISRSGSVPGDAIEITVECNPCSIDEAGIQMLRDVGVTRLSVGVQSLSAPRLEMLGRAHDATRALATLSAARRAGFAHVSADLIYGLPGESPAEAASEARAIAQSGPDHVSAYMLSVVPSTALGRAMRQGAVSPVDEAQAADSFIAVSDALVGLGYEHYEVSNFARTGCESKHNGWVWRGGSYVGLGAGAVGSMQLADGRVIRASNSADAQGYLEAMEACSAERLLEAGGVVQSLEVLDAETRMSERIMLGLRLAEGVDLDAVSAELGVEGWTRARQRAARELEVKGRLVREAGRARIPRHAWLWENDTAARML
ncbi:MAG: radical SAM family heme chaperone HemW [Deltaproteobacteria bacterium]|nr:radical SAM family heme chaperone HemW [Deltaproteobacteria bacterium]